MKTFLKAMACTCALFVLTGASCNKEDMLPPETQTGAYSFGCLINGKIFIPKGIGSDIDSYYQYIYPTGDNGYVFHISGFKNGPGECEIATIFINGDSIKLEEGKTYLLTEKGKGKMNATYRFNPPNCATIFTSYSTSLTSQGEITITKFDQTNQIVSGRYWFDVIDNLGSKIQIREGRFDTKYTR